MANMSQDRQAEAMERMAAAMEEHLDVLHEILHRLVDGQLAQMTPPMAPAPAPAKASKDKSE